MNWVWLAWVAPPKPDTTPVKADVLLRESAISSPPLPVDRKADIGAAARLDIDNAVTDLDNAAVDHGAAGDLHQAVRSACQ